MKWDYLILKLLKHWLIYGHLCIAIGHWLRWLSEHVGKPGSGANNFLGVAMVTHVGHWSMCGCQVHQGKQNILLKKSQKCLEQWGSVKTYVDVKKVGKCRKRWIWKKMFRQLHMHNGVIPYWWHCYGCQMFGSPICYCCWFNFWLLLA